MHKDIKARRNVR